MTKEELKQHCEKQVKMCEEWANGNEREPSGKIYEEHKLILDLIQALEQQPSDDVMAIHTQGLDKGIRCAMCTNSMKSDRGCDGSCVVDEDMYKKVMDTIKNHIMPPVTPAHGICKDCRWLTTDEDGNYYCKQTGYFDRLDFYCKDFTHKE